MKNLNKKTLSITGAFLTVLLAFSCIYSDCAPKPTPQTGEITAFYAEPDFVCLGGFGAVSNPTVRINFTANSSNQQRVYVTINNNPIGVGVPYQNGSGVWTGSYTINLNEVFHGQIPPQFTVVGKLQSDSGATVEPQTYDESSCTITTSNNCNTPGLGGN